MPIIILFYNFYQIPFIYLQNFAELYFFIKNPVNRDKFPKKPQFQKTGN